MDLNAINVALDNRKTQSRAVQWSEKISDCLNSVGNYTMTLRPAGADPIRDEGKYVVVYRRQADGSWKAAADIFNTNLPAS